MNELHDNKIYSYKIDNIFFLNCHDKWKIYEYIIMINRKFINI